MAKNTVYLFGAGVSAEVYPLNVSRINQKPDIRNTPLELYSLKEIVFDVFPALINENSTTLKYSFSSNARKGLKAFHSDTMELLKFQLNDFKTIDNFAEYLYKTNKKKELIILKQIISFTFELLRITQLNTNSIPFFFQNRSSSKDKRLVSLFLNFIKNDNSNPDYQRTKLKDNIKIITWNYDLMAENILEKLNVDQSSFYNFPRQIKNFIKTINDYKNCFLYHPNGISGVYRNKKDEIPIIDENTGNLDSFFETFFSLYGEIKENNVKYIDFFKYSFESSFREIEIEAYFKYLGLFAQRIIVIGYSFPIENWLYDRIFFETVNDNCEIIIQDPNLKKDNLLIKFPLFKKFTNLHVYDDISNFLYFDD